MINSNRFNITIWNFLKILLKIDVISKWVSKVCHSRAIKIEIGVLSNVPHYIKLIILTHQAHNLVKRITKFDHS